MVSEKFQGFDAQLKSVKLILGIAGIRIVGEVSDDFDRFVNIHNITLLGLYRACYSFEWRPCYMGLSSLGSKVL